MSKWGFIILSLLPMTWILVVCMFLFGYAVDDMDEDPVSEALGVDLTRYEEIEQWDTHGGFHGDGSQYVRLTFRGDEKQALEEAIEAKIQEWSRRQAAGGGMSGKQARERWYPLPMEENVQIAVYGRRTETDAGVAVMEPLVTNNACETPSMGKTLFPKVKDGYYFFWDRQGDGGNMAAAGNGPESGSGNGAGTGSGLGAGSMAAAGDNFLDRPSYNFTVALYDKNTGNLYYYELDT